MRLKENLQKKIVIEKLTAAVRATLGEADSGRRLDRESMTRLLAFGGYTHRRERDLDLYVDPQDESILVLDNGLAIYTTDAADVGLRKSPTVKEMLSLRNVVRILNDADVVHSKRLASLETVRRRALAGLDLSCPPEELEALITDGRAAWTLQDAPSVLEHLQLLAVLFDLVPLGEARLPAGCRGWARHGPDHRRPAAPVVVYCATRNQLFLLEAPLPPTAAAAADHLRRIAAGDETPFLSGTDVLTHLARHLTPTAPVVEP